MATDYALDALQDVQKAYPRPNLDLVNADAAALPLAGCAFDVVFALELIEHVRDYESLVRETARVLASASGAPSEATYLQWLASVLGEYSEALAEAVRTGRHLTHAFVNVTERRIGTNPQATAPQKVIGGAYLVAFVDGMSRRIAESFLEAGRARVPSGDPPPLPDDLARAAELSAALRPRQGCAVLFIGLGLAGAALGLVV